MDKYTIYCTAEQTKSAIELGASLDSPSVIYMDDKKNKENHIVHCMKRKPVRSSGNFIIPTAEQMIGWLEEQSDIEEITILRNRAFRSWAYLVTNKSNKLISSNNRYQSRSEATIAAIDAALEYLINCKNNIKTI